MPTMWHDDVSKHDTFLFTPELQCPCCYCHITQSRNTRGRQGICYDNNVLHQLYHKGDR